MVHVKKCNPKAFAAVKDGQKKFEYRQEDDCTYSVGDLLILAEFDPAPSSTVGTPKGYTGAMVRRRVTYVLRGEYGVPKGYAVLSLAPEEASTR